jgi:hypothetical protein
MTLLMMAALLLLVTGIFVRICIRLRKGGGSMTTIVLGATDAFLTHDRRKAAETIVNENAGKKFEEVPLAEPETNDTQAGPDARADLPGAGAKAAMTATR